MLCPFRYGMEDFSADAPSGLGSSHPAYRMGPSANHRTSAPTRRAPIAGYPSIGRVLRVELRARRDWTHPSPSSPCRTHHGLHRSNARSTHRQNPARPRASRRHAPPIRRESLAGSKVRYYALLCCAQPPPLDRRHRRARLWRPTEPNPPPSGTAAQPTLPRLREARKPPWRAQGISGSCCP